MAYKSGRHFLQIPGPTNIPDRVLRAIVRAVIDHRGPELSRIGLDVLAALGPVFGTTSPVIVFPSSGTGAWEAAIVNTLNVGDRVLMAETGQFATLWRTMAEKFGLVVDFLPSDWRQAADSGARGRGKRSKFCSIAAGRSGDGIGFGAGSNARANRQRRPWPVVAAENYQA